MIVCRMEMKEKKIRDRREGARWPGKVCACVCSPMPFTMGQEMFPRSVVLASPVHSSSRRMCGGLLWKASGTRERSEDEETGAILTAVTPSTY